MNRFDQSLVRRKIFHDLEKAMTSRGYLFYKSAHFLQRLDLRGVNVNTVLYFQLAVNHVLKKPLAEVEGKIIRVIIEGHHYFFRLHSNHPGARFAYTFACLTYYYNEVRFQAHADLTYTLARKSSVEKAN